MDTNTVLEEKDRARLDDIVSKMESNGESEDDIKFVVSDFKSKYGKQDSSIPTISLSEDEAKSSTPIQDLKYEGTIKRLQHETSKRFLAHPELFSNPKNRDIYYNQLRKSFPEEVVSQVVGMDAGKTMSDVIKEPSNKPVDLENVRKDYFTSIGDIYNKTKDDPRLKSQEARDAYWSRLEKWASPEDYQKIETIRFESDPSYKKKVYSMFGSIADQTPTGEYIGQSAKGAYGQMTHGYEKLADSKQAYLEAKGEGNTQTDYAKGLGGLAMNTIVGAGEALLGAASIGVPAISAFNVGSAELEKAAPEASQWMSPASKVIADHYAKFGQKPPKWLENAGSLFDFALFAFTIHGVHKGAKMIDEHGELNKDFIDIVEKSTPEEIDKAMNLGKKLREQQEEKTRSVAEMASQIKTSDEVTPKPKDQSAELHNKLTRDTAPSHYDKLASITPETPVSEIPEGTSVNYKNVEGQIKKDPETGEVLFKPNVGKEEIIGGASDQTTISDKGIHLSEGSYSDKHGNFYVEKTKGGHTVYKVSSDGKLTVVYEGEKANLERRNAIIKKALKVNDGTKLAEVKSKVEQLSSDLEAVKGTSAEPVIQEQLDHTKELADDMEHQHITEKANEGVKQVAIDNLSSLKADLEAQAAKLSDAGKEALQPHLDDVTAKLKEAQGEGEPVKEEVTEKVEEPTADTETPTEQTTEVKEEAKPIRQLGTGANVYFETDKYRVNDSSNGSVVLNIRGDNPSDPFPISNPEFKDKGEAMYVADKLQNTYPKGVPDAVLIDKVIDNWKKEYQDGQKPKEVKIEPTQKPTEDVPIESATEVGAHPSGDESVRGQEKSAGVGQGEQGNETARKSTEEKVARTKYLVDAYNNMGKRERKSKEGVALISEISALNKETGHSLKPQKRGGYTLLNEKGKEVKDRGIPRSKDAIQSFADDKQVNMFGGEKPQQLFNDEADLKQNLKSLTEKEKEIKDRILSLESERDNIQPENQTAIPVEEESLKQSIKDSVTDAAEKLKKALAADLPEGTQKLGVGVSDVIDAAVKVIHSAIDAGFTVKEAIEKGIDHIKENWDKKFGELPEDRVRKVFESEEFSKAYSIKNAAADVRMDQLGMKEAYDAATKEAKRAWGTVWDTATKAIESKEIHPENLAKSIVDNPRPLTDVEEAALLHENIRLENEREKVVDAINAGVDEARLKELRIEKAKIENDIYQNYTASKFGGRETARSLNARKMLADRKYSLTNMENEIRSDNNGKPLTEDQQKVVAEIHSDIKEKAAKWDQFQTDYEGYFNERYKELLAENEKLKAEKILSESIKKRAKRTESKQKLDDEFEELSKEFSRVVRGTLNAGINPEVVPIITRMVKNRIDKGIITLSEVVDSLHDKLAEHGITKEDIVSVIAGNKSVGKVTRSDAAKQLASLRSEAKLIEKYEQLKSGVDNYTKKVRAEKNVRLENLRKQIKEHDITKLSDYKKRVNSQIDRLEQSLVNPKDKTSASSVSLDEEALTLKQKKDQLLDLKRQSDLIKKYEQLESGIEPSSDIKIKEKNKKLEELKKQIKEHDLQKLADYKKGIKRRIERLKDMLASNDPSVFSSERKAKDVQMNYDEESLRLQSELQDAKDRFEQEKEKIRLQNMGFTDRQIEKIIKYSREGMLTGIATLGKLGSFAVELQLLLRPIYNASGKVLSVIPAVRRLSDLSPTEGGFNAESLGKGYAAFFDKKTYQEAYNKLKKGKSKYDLAYGGNRYAERPMLPTRSHGAIKHIPFESARAYSVDAATKWLERNGQDPNDPILKQWIGAYSYAKGMDAIYMGDSKTLRWYQMKLHVLNQRGGGYKFASAFARIVFPIVKVPYNFGKDVMVKHTPYQLVKSMRDAFTKDIEKLSPEERDAIMLNMKKGFVGTVALYLGWKFYNSYGGNYTREKGKGAELNPGDVVYGGVHIPHFATHNAFFEANQIGSTMHYIYDNIPKNKDGSDKYGDAENIGRALLMSGASEAEKLPFVGETSRGLESLNTWSGFKDYSGQFVGSRIVPRMIQEVGEVMDGKKRKPDGFWEQIQSKIPYYRESLPEKSAPQPTSGATKRKGKTSRFARY